MTIDAPTRSVPPPPESARPDPQRTGLTTLGKNPERSRDHNRRVVLDLLRGHGRLGRRQIAEMARLTTQAVANILDDLEHEGLISRAGRLRAGRGQPPLQFVLNPDGAITVGLELAVGRIVSSVLDLSGQLRESSTLPVTEMAPATLIPRIVRHIAAVRARFPASLTGVGLVMPGPFEIEGLSGIGPTTLPGWEGADAASLLSEALSSGDEQIPVWVENDANASAVAELLFGAGQNLRNFCAFYFGAGTGLGIVADGRPLRGAFGNAGEIGHIVVAPNGRACSCGQRGCLECYASAHALAEALGVESHVAAAEMAGALFARQAPVLMAWIDEAAEHLSTIVRLIENMFDPETVIFVGALPDAVIDAIIGKLHLGPSVAARRHRTLPRVIRGQTGQLTASLGAASLPLFNALTPQLDRAGTPVA